MKPSPALQSLIYGATAEVLEDIRTLPQGDKDRVLNLMNEGAPGWEDRVHAILKQHGKGKMESLFSPPSPMNREVYCKLCGDCIILNEDSDENRKKRTDPHQQLRGHIRDSHNPLEYAPWVTTAGWLFDTLLFRPSPEFEPLYRDTVHSLSDHFLDMLSVEDQD